jgi:hypothetical protein
LASEEAERGLPSRGWRRKSPAEKIRPPGEVRVPRTTVRMEK